MNSVLNFYTSNLSQDGYIVRVSNVNNFTKTHDGLDAMAERLTKFVLDERDANRSINKISFVGHSLGGLMIRGCIKKLNDLYFFSTVKPMAYISVASPHRGIDEIVYWRQVAARYIIGNTGLELLKEDKKEMLSTLDSPEYINALDLFIHKVVYGNAIGDTSVSFKSACICSQDFTTLFPNHEKHKLYDIPNESTDFWIRKAIDFSDCYIAHNYIINRGLTKQNIVLQDTLQYIQ
jgi:hypothetical protein